MASHDAIIVGAGPNGLSAAITLAQAGHSVLVLEANETPGGGATSRALTLPGFIHDHCSAVHPMALESAFFSSLPLATHGLEWIHPPAPLAHPLDDGTAVLLERSLPETAAGLGQDEIAYTRLFQPLLDDWDYLKSELLGPFQFPEHPLRLARFGLPALVPTTLLARTTFRQPRARALFAGIAAHSVLALERPGSSAFGLVLGLAGHHAGWPLPKGGAGAITRALVSHLQSLGGELRTGTPVTSLKDLPESRVVLFDLTPRQILAIARNELSPGFCRSLERYRYGPGVFKLDWALDGPIPWRAPETARAATVHLGGTLQEVAQSERNAWQGRESAAPFVLLVQPSLFDPTRAPAGKQTAWAYCHVPNDSRVDMTERIEAQVERFAPGFRSKILARSVLSPQRLQHDNGNLIGGDIGGGAANLLQLLFRPTRHLYGTSNPRYFICSSSTPPGGGVHGLCGYHAALAAIKKLRG
jgi:phytoene dehydrogenase-like protein